MLGVRRAAEEPWSKGRAHSYVHQLTEAAVHPSEAQRNPWKSARLDNMNLSYVVAFGLLVTLLSERMEAKPLTQAQQKSLRSLLGDELAEFLESEERERRIDSVRSRMRLLRDLRMDTRARGMWARLLNDQTATRRHKSGSKKGGSSSRSGCFGHKMDRIGTISGMGC